MIEKFAVVFKMQKGNNEEKKQKIRDFYKSKSFQSVSTQTRLFKEVFDIDVTIDDGILKLVEIRNIIAHRNSITQSGYIYKIKKSQLLEALSVVETYIINLAKSLINFETSLYAKRINNSK